MNDDVEVLKSEPKAKKRKVEKTRLVDATVRAGRMSFHHRTTVQNHSKNTNVLGIWCGEGVLVRLRLDWG